MKTPLRKRFGSRVKELRQASGMSQEAFADRCGFVRSYMSRIERGGANPSLDAVEVLADALGVEVFRLFLFDGEPTATTGALKVPFSKDGSYFSPSTFRPKTKQYNVGEKGRGNTKQFDNFEEALAYLRAMPVAKWWRPEKNGKWGLVTAVRWGELPDAGSN